MYAHVRFPCGREDTVFVRDLAPSGDAAGDTTGGIVDNGKNVGTVGKDIVADGATTGEVIDDGSATGSDMWPRMDLLATMKLLNAYRFASLHVKSRCRIDSYIIRCS